MAAEQRVVESPVDSGSGCEEELAAIDAVIYADLFDCAVDREMLRRFRLSGGPSEASICTIDRLAADGILAEKDEALCLVGREALLDSFPRRRARAKTLRRRAARLARRIRHVPFVRGLCLTGSTAAGVAPAGADVDLLVIVAPGRLATVWLFLGGFAMLTRRAFFCPNYYLSADALEIHRQTHFVAREVVQSRPLFGLGASFACANRWAYQRFPAVEVPEETASRPDGSFPQRSLESLLKGRIGEWLEGCARRLAEARLRRHYQEGLGDVPAEVERQWASGEALRFHGSASLVGIMKRYRARRAEVAAQLDAVRSPTQGTSNG